jgi:hypothetical protein
MALGFSLSPAVTVREINLTGSVPNLPSAKTGMILRADQGPALDITSITNETDLISKFGKPNTANYQDWFQCWNFLQYSSSLYVVRPIDANTTVKNAGIGITGTAGSSNLAQENLFNPRVAENTLENFSDAAESLYFFNREITSNQRYALGICSTPKYFKSPIGLEFFANVTNAIGTTSVTASGVPTLTNGSKVILNGSKLATVTTVSQSTSATATITFDRTIDAVDIGPMWANVVSGETPVAGGINFYALKEGFTLKKGAYSATAFAVPAYVTNIQNNPNNALEYIVTLNNSSAEVSTGPLSLNEIQYVAYTAYNNANVQFGIEAGATELYLQPGFILEPGVVVDIDETFSLIVASVDETLNKITFVSPAPLDVSVSSSLSIATSIITLDSLITGINYFDKVYDAGLIQKTRMTLSLSGGEPVSVIAQSLLPFNKIFEYPPNYANGEFAVVVLRKNDSGLYESFEQSIASYTPDARDVNGSLIYAEDLFFKTSESLYCKIGSTTSQRVDTGPTALPKILSTPALSATIYPQKVEYGKVVYDAFGYTQGDIMQAYSMFADPESFDINILICHALDMNYASTIAESRKDCMAIVAPFDYAYLSTKSNTDCTSYLLDNFGSQVDFDGKIFYTFGTYTAVYGNMKYQYDKFNNVNRWVNVSGDLAGLYAQTDNTNDPWWAVAGTLRGVIKNAIKLAFNPNKQNRDELYVNSINPIMAIAGEGSAIVWGQKTATATPSAFDRVNVRRLLIYLEKSIATASNIGLFEFNDTFTRTRLFNIIDPFLRTVQARRGLYAYKLVIDESNNTSQVIDSNGLVIDIYLQPTKVAEFIRVSAIVVPTGASFQEYVGSF